MATKRGIGAAAVAATIALLAILLYGSGDKSGVGQAITLLDSESRFSNTYESARTFAKTADLLKNEATVCVSEQGESAVLCQAQVQAFALTQTAAVNALQCTKPGIYELRKVSLAYLRAVQAVESGVAVSAPPFPAVPHCSR